jgi:hypothetical protein
LKNFALEKAVRPGSGREPDPKKNARTPSRQDFQFASKFQRSVAGLPAVGNSGCAIGSPPTRPPSRAPIELNSAPNWHAFLTENAVWLRWRCAGGVKSARTAEERAVIEHDWKQIEAELDELQPRMLERKNSAAPKSGAALAPEDEAAVLKHIAEALRLDE